MTDEKQITMLEKLVPSSTLRVLNQLKEVPEEAHTSEKSENWTSIVTDVLTAEELDVSEDPNNVNIRAPLKIPHSKIYESSDYQDDTQFLVVLQLNKNVLVEDSGELAILVNLYNRSDDQVKYNHTGELEISYTKDEITEVKVHGVDSYEIND